MTTWNRPTIQLVLAVALLPASLIAENFRAYLPSRSSKSLLVVRAEAVGAGVSLTLESKVEFDFTVTTITAHPTVPLLYLSSNRGDPEAPGAVVLLDEEGRYQSHAEVQYAHGYSYLSVDRSGRFLLGASYATGHVDVYGLHADGGLGERVSWLDEGRKNAHCVLPSPDNRFVYVPYVKDNNALFQYRFDAQTGSLKALEPKNAEPPAGTGPRHMAYHPTKPFVYFSNEQNVGVSVYEKGPDGQLKFKQVCDAVDSKRDKSGLSASDIWITPDGQFLFAGLRGSSQDFSRISRYRVKDTGEVELLGLTEADATPWGMALSPKAGYLLVTAFTGGTLTAYRITEDGGLAKAGMLPIDTKVSDLVTR